MNEGLFALGVLKVGFLLFPLDAVLKVARLPLSRASEPRR